jgi:NCAIR mutase (PurE)-related protein
MAGPDDFVFDDGRLDRIGIAEAVFCAPKSPAQIETAIAHARAGTGRLLLTRLAADQHDALGGQSRALLDYDPISRTAILGDCPAPEGPARIAIAAAGTSDLPVAMEAERTLAFHGQAATLVLDIGVAGLWRLMQRREQLAAHPIVIAVAGMEGAFFSVLGGLIGSVVLAVPSSTGYGVGAGGRAALTSALASCAPGILTLNIDNGYGAACAALRILHQIGTK